MWVDVSGEGLERGFTSFPAAARGRANRRPGAGSRSWGWPDQGELVRPSRPHTVPVALEARPGRVNTQHPPCQTVLRLAQIEGKCRSAEIIGRCEQVPGHGTVPSVKVDVPSGSGL